MDTFISTRAYDGKDFSRGAHLSDETGHHSFYKTLRASVSSTLQWNRERLMASSLYCKATYNVRHWAQGLVWWVCFLTVENNECIAKLIYDVLLMDHPVLVCTILCLERAWDGWTIWGNSQRPICSRFPNKYWKNQNVTLSHNFWINYPNPKFEDRSYYCNTLISHISINLVINSTRPLGWKSFWHFGFG